MTSPTPTPPYLGEREAVARTGELLKNRLPLRCHCDSCRAQLVKDLVEAAVATLRTENETLRAERDAAIARAEALAKVSLIQARELKRLDPTGNTPPDLDAAMANLRTALTTPEHTHGD